MIEDSLPDRFRLISGLENTGPSRHSDSQSPRDLVNPFGPAHLIATPHCTH